MWLPAARLLRMCRTHAGLVYCSNVTCTRQTSMLIQDSGGCTDTACALQVELPHSPG